MPGSSNDLIDDIQRGEKRRLVRGKICIAVFKKILFFALLTTIRRL
jgi:hypothetical protein